MSESLDEPMSTATGDQESIDEAVLRRRNPWNSLVTESIDLLADVDELDDEEEEDGVGCPLPSTPEDNQLLEAEVRIMCFFFSMFLLGLNSNQNTIDIRKPNKNKYLTMKAQIQKTNEIWTRNRTDMTFHSNKFHTIYLQFECLAKKLILLVNQT